MIDHLHPVITIHKYWCAMVWCSMIWFGIVWFGLVVWPGISMDYSDYLPAFLTDYLIHKSAGGVAQ